jgi:hypothetical protein
MKTATRSRAGPARWLALLATALLFMGTIATPALGEAEDFGEAEILSSPDNTCDKAFPDLDKIDQESGTFTTEEGVVLEWGGYGASAKNAVHYTVPEGYTLDLCIKGGEGAETPAYYEGLTGTGSVTTLYERDVSHISYRVNVLPPTGSATVLKAWDGDLFDDARTIQRDLHRPHRRRRPAGGGRQPGDRGRASARRSPSPSEAVTGHRPTAAPTSATSATPSFTAHGRERGRPRLHHHRSPTPSPARRSPSAGSVTVDQGVGRRPLRRQPSIEVDLHRPTSTATNRS